MAKREFKDGDWVEFFGGNYGDMPHGEVGQIMGYKDSDYAVSFPWLESHYYYAYDRNHGHDCDGLLPPGSVSGLWVNPLHLRITAVSIAAVSKKTTSEIAFDSVIIHDEKRQQIVEALEQINQQELIFGKWGFGETIEKGKGISMLFYGPPGTGKTLMAQAIAHKHNCKLRIISTADIESAMPGESERNIREHFANAKKNNSIILFDECDSLVYTRQNVGPILGAQINELLSQLERFEGITIFTTNRLGTLDEALNRRLALKLEFPIPTPDQRAEIWKRMFPKQAPIAEDVDWSRLAIVEITGGYIKNAVLRAARMAAIEKLPDKKKKIKMDHLVKALKLETESMMKFEQARAETQGRIIDVGIGAGGERVVKANSAMGAHYGE